MAALFGLPEHLELGLTAEGLKDLSKRLPDDAIAQCNAARPEAEGGPAFPAREVVDGARAARDSAVGVPVLRNEPETTRGSRSAAPRSPVAAAPRRPLRAAALPGLGLLPGDQSGRRRVRGARETPLG